MAKIIQIMQGDENDILGLGDDGVVYVASNGAWEEFMEGLPSKDITPPKTTIARQKRFKPPVIGDVHMYIFRQGISNAPAREESEKFCDFYASKDWMVGKNKMKDWKAAVRNWLKNYKPTTGLDMNSTAWIDNMGEVL